MENVHTKTMRGYSLSVRASLVAFVFLCCMVARVCVCVRARLHITSCTLACDSNDTHCMDVGK